MAHIKTFARIKPSKRTYDDYEATNSTLYMRVPDILRDSNGQVRTRLCTVNHEFKFTHVFNNQAPQEEVFNHVAKDIIDGFLSGYNGTIFAYGQTGSGKTFTVEGSARRYEDRGLAPRSLSMIYNELEARGEEVEATIHVSYMEIYQEVGYDLLNQAARGSSAVTPFPKVAVVEGTKGSCVVRNLSTHLAANEDVAQSLLLQGQANRKVAETPMNQRSSRSHAVFTITLTAKQRNSEIITKSKLHLVDLAGSERVSKTGINGQQLAEAKYINLSLHYLEGVIIALHQDQGSYRPHTANQSSFYKRVLAERSHPYKRPQRVRSSAPGVGQTQRTKKDNSSSWSNVRPSSADGYRSYSAVKHVPYRNSLLTMVLKDSLGGNCQTAMIATVSMEEENLSESLSTCRFSQRVACITNTVRKNEEIDDKLMIKRLRKRIAELETELALLKSGQGGEVDTSLLDSKLTDDDKRDCARIIQSYLGGQISDPITAGVKTPLRFRECMRLFKAMVKTLQTDGTRTQNNRPLNAWTEVREPRPRTVPTNMKVMTSGLDSSSSSNVRANSTTQLNSSTTSSRTTLNTSHTSHRSHSASTLPNSPPNAASDLDLRMSQMSLVRDSLQSRGSSSQSKRPVDSRSGSRASSRNSYKSPFERKREKTIKLLADQVRKKRNEQQEEREHLKDFQESIREQQLVMIHAELSAKADENRRQLADQHARVKQLKADGQNEQLYSQEKLIERQLRKRQAKMEKRIGLLEEHMELLAQQEEEAQNDTKKQGAQTEPKDPTKAKGFGTVINSRMVLDKLQEENKKQEKSQVKIEEDRVLALSQQIELKEAATRQKLRDFKLRLQESKTEGGSRTVLSIQPRVSEPQPVIVDMEEEPVKDSNKKPNDTFTISFNVKKGTNSQTSPFDSVFSGPRKQPAIEPKPKTSSHMNGKENQYQDMFTKREPKKNFDDLWAKSYTSSRQNSMIGNNVKNDPFSSGLPSKKDIFGDITSPKLGSSPVKEAGYEDLPSDLIYNVQNGVSGHEDADLEESDLALDLDTDYIPSKDEPKVKSTKVISPREIMKSLTEAAKQSQQRHSQLATNPTPQKTTTTKDKIRPSEYANQDHNESFDANKMGLSHKTFESALQSMLAMEGSDKPGPLTIQPKEYDEFARQNRQDSTVTARGIYSQRLKGQSRTQERPRRRDAPPGGQRGRASNSLSPKRDQPKPRPVSSDAWGPESKNMSMSDRLSRFLDTDVLPSNRPKPGKGQSFEDSDVAPYRRPRVLDEAEPSSTNPKPAKMVDMDVDDYKPPIKALPEKKRETAYMSTVREQKDRVTRIRRARRAAEVIQRAWKNYRLKLGGLH